MLEAGARHSSNPLPHSHHRVPRVARLQNTDDPRHLACVLTYDTTRSIRSNFNQSLRASTPNRVFTHPAQARTTGNVLAVGGGALQVNSIGEECRWV
jgi:hypothetical protein